MSDRALATTQSQSSTRVTPSVRGFLQRKCACGNHTMSGECEDCKRKKGMMQPASLFPRGSRIEGEGQVPEIVHEVLRSPGQPLDAATRAYMEPRFGHDFSEVRVHTDAKAAESARAVNALAYTVGRDVVFGAGLYALESVAGKHLLAHELAHTIQQKASPTDTARALQIAKPGTSFELEADSAADSVVTCGIASVKRRSENTALYRQPYSGPNVGPPVRELPKPPMVSCGKDTKGDWVCKGENIPGIGSTPEIPVDPRKIPEKIKDVLAPGAAARKGLADCRGFVTFATPGGSQEFKGQCCEGIESKDNCCPPERIVTGPLGDRCCKEDEVATKYHRECVKSSTTPSAGASPKSQPKPTPTPVPATLQPVPSVDLGIGQLQLSPSFLASIGSLTIDGFALDKPDLTHDHKVRLDIYAKFIRLLLATDPDATIEIWGHTDATGTEEHNMALGQQRAEAARDELVANGTPPDRLRPHSAGRTQLKVKTNEANPQNRRVEIRFEPSIKKSVPDHPTIVPPTIVPHLSLPG